MWFPNFFLNIVLIGWTVCSPFSSIFAKGIFLTLGDRRWISTLGVELPTTLAGALVAAFGEDIYFIFLIASFVSFSNSSRGALGLGCVAGTPVRSPRTISS